MAGCWNKTVPSGASPEEKVGRKLSAQLSLQIIFTVGIIANIPAVLTIRFKNITPEGAILELVVWKVPEPVPPTEHGYKYSAVYVVDGVRVVGFDNERGKGDHCHLDGTEVPYTFVSVEQLVEDFIAAVAARRSL